MRPGNNNRRGRNRGPRKQHGGIPNKNQSYDGGGSETRVRGNVYQILEKYLQLARDAGVSGDRIAAENYLQHADHYYRVVQSMNDGQRPRVGGRDISVADFNVQNVSQGLSAALYTGGQAPQPNIADDGSPNPNPQQGNGGNSNANGNGEDDGEDGGDDNDSTGNAPPQHQGRGPRRQPHNRQGQHNNGSYGQGGGNQNNSGANGTAQNNATQVVAAPASDNAAPAAASAPQPVVAKPGVGEDQPDYPENLLPAPAAGEAPGRGEARGAGSPRPRGPRQQRPRRPRAASSDEAGSDNTAAEPALPGVDGGE